MQDSVFKCLRCMEYVHAGGGFAIQKLVAPRIIADAGERKPIDVDAVLARREYLDQLPATEEFLQVHRGHTVTFETLGDLYETGAWLDLMAYGRLNPREVKPRTLVEKLRFTTWAEAEAWLRREAAAVSWAKDLRLLGMARAKFEQLVSDRGAGRRISTPFQGATPMPNHDGMVQIRAGGRFVRSDFIIARHPVSDRQFAELAARTVENPGDNPQVMQATWAETIRYCNLRSLNEGSRPLTMRRPASCSTKPGVPRGTSPRLEGSACRRVVSGITPPGAGGRTRPMPTGAPSSTGSIGTIPPRTRPSPSPRRSRSPTPSALSGCWGSSASGVPMSSRPVGVETTFAAGATIAPTTTATSRSRWPAKRPPRGRAFLSDSC